MTEFTLIAESDLELQCESGTLNFKRGDQVFLEVDENDDPFITVFEQDGEKKVHYIEVNITTLEVLDSLLENVSILEDEYSNKISYQEMSIDDLLLNEGVELDTLTCYLAESAMKKRTVAKFGDGKAKLSVPGFKKEKNNSQKQRAARIKQKRKAPRVVGAKATRVKALKANKYMGESSFLIQTSLLLDESSSVVAEHTKTVLEQFLNTRAEVSVTKESKVIVKLSEADVADLEEALKLADVNYLMEGTDSEKVITLVVPQNRQVVESYYANKDAIDTTVSLSEEEDKDDDKDDEDDENPFAKAESMFKKMKEKMKELEETDFDQEKADKALEAYKGKMEKMKDMEDKDQEKMMKEMEGDYHKFIKMISPAGK